MLPVPLKPEPFRRSDTRRTVPPQVGATTTALELRMTQRPIRLRETSDVSLRRIGRWVIRSSRAVVVAPTCGGTVLLVSDRRKGSGLRGTGSMQHLQQREYGRKLED